VSVFRRNRSGAEDPASSESSDALDPTTADEAEATTEDDAVQAAEPAAAVETRAPFDREGGPHDVSEIDDDLVRLDLGSVRIAPAEGVEIRVEIDEATGAVQGVTFVADDSALQIGAFAAPRSEGIWDEVRNEIAAGITASGGTADQADGELGPELHARVTGEDDKGRPVTQPVRFLGVDGPRWFLRGLISGAGSTDPAAAARLIETFRGVVVVRGDDPMAPHEPLPLALPKDALEAVEEVVEDDDADDLEPFTRGPEITEIR
jgi:hypothetical protein